MAVDATNELERLFYPRTIAVVGASPDAHPFLWGGKSFLMGIMKQNFSGRLYPVNPRSQNVLGLKAYKSIGEIPEDIDLAIFSVPSSAVLEVMKDCARKRVKFAHIFTAGFSETDMEERAELEEEVLRVAQAGRVRVVGPNCMGVYCPEGGVAWTDNFPTESGPVGFVSQSGQLASQFIDCSGSMGIRFSKAISFGNARDLQCHDFLAYLEHDDKTRMIGSYIEGLKDGRAFFEIARRLTTTKPLVVWKGGQTEGGTRAVNSHTASIAGSHQIWQALCRQAGIISVNSMSELVSTMVALQHLTLPSGPNAAIVGGAGGGSVTMTDTAEREGLRVPQLSETTVRELGKLVPVQGQSVKNPLDIFSIFFDLGHFKRMMELLGDDPEIDVLIYSQLLDTFIRRGAGSLLDGIIEATIESAKDLPKPLFLVLEQGLSMEGEVARREVLKRYHQAGIATFPNFDEAARAVYNLMEYRKYLSSKG